MKRQENLTNFMLDDTETIVSVITGMKSSIFSSVQDRISP